MGHAKNMVDVHKYIERKRLAIKTKRLLIREFRGRMTPKLEDEEEGLVLALTRDFRKALGVECLVLHIHRLGLTLEEVKYTQRIILDDNTTDGAIAFIEMITQLTISESAACYIYDTTPRVGP